MSGSQRTHFHSSQVDGARPDRQHREHCPSRPATRWWWFSGPIRDEDVRWQLEWLKDNGFGGVEIAWLYPLDPSRRGAEWLSPEWSRLVTVAKRHADRLGLRCDFTFGSLWPFGGQEAQTDL